MHEYTILCAEFVHIILQLQIEKKEVDNFKPGKRIPSCQLIAECETEQPADLKHSVKLSGAKDPNAAFLIYRRCHPGKCVCMHESISPYLNITKYFLYCIIKMTNIYGMKY